MFRAVSAAAILLGGSLALAACAAPSGPGEAQSSAYLQRAQAAAQAHDAAAALAALDGAESTWMTTTSAQGNPCMYYEKPELRAIGYARDSVKQARWQDAGHYIGEALSNVGAPG